MTPNGPQRMERSGRRPTRRGDGNDMDVTASRRAVRAGWADPPARPERPGEPSATAAVPVWRRLPIILGAASGIGLCAIVLALALFFTHAQPAPPDPTPTARALCVDLQAQDYAATYTLLSARLRAEGTASQFAASQRRLDIQRGPVTSCAPTIQHADAAQAAVSLTLTRGTSAAQTASVTLIYEAGAWAVDAYDPALV